MHWLWFALISVTAFSVSTLFQRVIMRKSDSDPIVSAIVVEFLWTALSATVTIWTGFHMPPSGLWPYFLFSAGLYALGTVAFFKAAKHLEASENTILGGTGSIITIIASYLFLSERFSFSQAIGAILILAAVVVVNISHKRITLHQGSWSAIFGAACYGLAVVSDGFILRSYDSFSFIPFASLLTCILLIFMFPGKIPVILRDIRKINPNLIVYGIIYVVAAETFYIPLTMGALVSQMSTITRATIILTVILAMVFLKERSHPWKKLAGAVLTTAGIWFIR